MNKQELRNLIYALQDLVFSSPGLSIADYCDRKSYWCDRAKVSKQLKEAVRMLDILWSFIEKNKIEKIEEDLILTAYDRVQITKEGEGFRVRYIAGQYYSLEYRQAVAYWCYRVLISLAMQITDYKYQEAKKLLIENFPYDKKFLKSYFN
jgi:hypothetical protein